MYCRKCGENLLDGDRYCAFCGAEVYERKEKQPEKEEFIGFKTIGNKTMPFNTTGEGAEEVIFNHVEDSKNDDGFVWNVNEFSSSEKTEDIQFDWHLSEGSDNNINNSESPFKDQRKTVTIAAQIPIEMRKTKEITIKWDKDSLDSKENHEARLDEEASGDKIEPPAINEEAEAAELISGEALEKSIFKEVQAASNCESGVRGEEFYTFSKKNEEFQKLLDKEYEKLKQNKDSVNGIDRNEVKTIDESENLNLDVDDVDKVSGLALAAILDLETEADKASEAGNQISKLFDFEDEVEAGIENEIETLSISTEELITEDVMNIVETPAAESIEEKAIEKTEQIEENADEIIEPVEEKVAEEIKKNEEDSQAAQNTQLQNGVNSQAAQNSEIDQQEHITKIFNEIDEVRSVEGRDDFEKKLSPAVKVIIAIVVILLLIEGIILGIRYFAPNSNASAFIDTNLGLTINWAEGFLPQISKNEVKKKPPLELEDNTQVEEIKPNPDLNALVESQLESNKNIEVVQGDPILAYEEGYAYADADIKTSRPINGNLWFVDQKGKNILFDEVLVSTVIDFDSKWIDYANEGRQQVMSLVKAGSNAEKNLLKYNGKGITKKFKLLSIGDIRVGAKGFYVWTREEIETTQNGKATEATHYWIYYLEAIDNQMKIVDYYQYQSI